jgi:hypothetical protein
MSVFILVLFFLSVYFVTQSSLKKEHDITWGAVIANVPTLLRAWCSSAAWALGCIGSCALLWWWASENNAFEFGDQGQDHLLFLILAVPIAAVLFHKRAYKQFQQVYLARGASRHAGRPGLMWLLLLSLWRTSWILAILFLIVMLLFKGSNTNAGWQ